MGYSRKIRRKEGDRPAQKRYARPLGPPFIPRLPQVSRLGVTIREHGALVCAIVLLDRILANHHDPSDPVMQIAWDFVDYHRHKARRSLMKRFALLNEIHLAFDALQDRDGQPRDVSDSPPSSDQELTDGTGD